MKLGFQIFILSILLLTSTGCVPEVQDRYIPPDKSKLPIWLANVINRVEADPGKHGERWVVSYKLEGNTIYEIGIGGCCDLPSYFYSEQGQQICTRQGFTGHIDHNGNTLCKILNELQYNDVTRRPKVNLIRSPVWYYKSTK